MTEHVYDLCVIIFLICIALMFFVGLLTVLISDIWKMLKNFLKKSVDK